MSSAAAAGSEPGPCLCPGTATGHEPAMAQAPLQQEVVMAAAEVPAPASTPGSMVVAAAEAPGALVTIVISQPEEVALSPEPKGVAPASPAPLEAGDEKTVAAGSLQGGGAGEVRQLRRAMQSLSAKDGRTFGRPWMQMSR